jgi:hypothetical protein
MTNKDLTMWQERLAKAEEEYSAELSRMDRREQLYRGTREITAVTEGEKTTQAAHVRNIVAELIESQVDSTIPMPKVTARYEKDQPLAKMIEDMLRNELDRLPTEYLNDMMERCVPLQGGGLWLIEWDNTEGTHTTTGEVTLTALHPKQVIPQPGVLGGIEEMDYIFVKLTQTKEHIYKRYGVKVQDEAETEPDIRAVGGDDPSDELITQYIAYYRNENGGIGLYSWAGDTEIASYDDYQARRARRCTSCGATNGDEKATKCDKCGAKLEDMVEDMETVYGEILKADGTMISGAQMGTVTDDETGETRQGITPNMIPYYKPNIYPVVLQKNVSVYGRFLGDSDADKLETHQNTINRIETKIITQLIKSGSYMTLPTDPSIRMDTDEMKPIRIKTPQDISMINVLDMQGNIEQPLVYLNQVYEEARQIIGITDSFQGRKDATATSGKAKQFAAAQSAGRLESKRVMKHAAYATLFEAIFKFKLAYADEARPVVATDVRGNSKYEAFRRYDFLERDDAGEYYWNDNFLFSTDTAATLANNRETMWQETRNNLQTGAFGNPQDINTLILFWTKMELLHYPGAADTKNYMLMQQQQQQQMMDQAQAQMMQRAQQQQMMQQRAPIPIMPQETAQPRFIP